METRSIDDTSGYLQFESNLLHTIQPFFVLQVPMVSSDGQPHKVLTMVAVGSGLGAAIVVLLILVALIARQRQSQPSSGQPGAGDRLLAKQERSKSLFSLFSKRASLDITILDANYLQRVAQASAAPEVDANAGETSTPSATTMKLECIDETQSRRAPEATAEKRLMATNNNNTTEMLPRVEEKLLFVAADGKLTGISTISC